MLTSNEIEAVQGEPPRDTKPGIQSKDGLTVSHCYFGLPTLTKSISLQIVQKDAQGGPRSPKQQWKETLHKESPVPASETAKKKEPPQKIDGLGDEAFWTGNQSLGALYVLKGDIYFRLSLGGGDDMETKIRKSTELADKILLRL